LTAFSNNFEEKSISVSGEQDKKNASVTIAVY
jgi:hypothetical protein